MRSETLTPPTALNFEQVKALIPQRFPFLMLDRVIEIEPGKRVVGIKNLTGNEPFYQGHFPKRAVTPGAMLCEAMAQTGIVFFSLGHGEPRDVTYLLGSLKARFIEPVWPGDQLHIEVLPIKVMRDAGIISATVRVGERVVAKAELALAAKANDEL
jgi:3-hydroxyacyl-[acyl-carrier-protein] dehydratase